MYATRPCSATWLAWAALVLLVACSTAQQEPETPEGVLEAPPPDPGPAFDLRPFDPAMDPEPTLAAGMVAEQWLEITRVPGQPLLAVARPTAVDLRRWPSGELVWSVEVTPGLPFVASPHRPPMTVTRDGAGLAWLGGMQSIYRFVVFALADGGVRQDLVFNTFPETDSGDGGETQLPRVSLIAHQADGSFALWEPFGVWRLDPAAPSLDRLAAEARPFDAWTPHSQTIVTGPDGQTWEPGCSPSAAPSVASAEGRLAVLCAHGATAGVLRLVAVESGETVQAWPFPTVRASIAVMDSDHVLAFDRDTGRTARFTVGRDEPDWKEPAAGWWP